MSVFKEIDLLYDRHSKGEISDEDFEEELRTLESEARYECERGDCGL